MKPMSDDIDSRLQQRIYDGNRAKEVLENEVFQGAFLAIELEMTETWKKSPARDAEGREKIWQYLMLLQKVKTHLEATMQDGKVADLDLEHRRTVAQRLRDGWNSFSE
jgi:hypothetical protein